MIVEKICTALKIHTELEEEIFYPAVRKAIDDSDLMDEALVEHAGAKELVAQLEESSPDDDLYDAKVTVLGEQIDHHVKERKGGGNVSQGQEGQKSTRRPSALQMLKRKTLLMKKMGLNDDDATDDAKVKSTGAKR